MFEVVPTNDETWLICGGRGFTDAATFDAAMGDLMRLRGCPNKIVHGGARGADELAGEFGRRMGVETVAVYPEWDKHGKAAGVLRNQRMLDDYKPKLIVAFPGGRGTADMVRRARAVSADVAEIKLS